jgi:hypothetical protein
VHQLEHLERFEGDRLGALARAIRSGSDLIGESGATVTTIG